MFNKLKKVSTEAYKGVRDFFPEDMAIQKQIFGIWAEIAEKYGYEEYSASILEPAELYKSKTSDEIVNEQTYTFTDRGDREVTLRPEMTPTLARMVSAKRRDLVFPLRWYSIPNLFRYEQPQRGRLREHWQLNVDIFGVDSLNAEIEIINMASDIIKGYGLKETDFEIRLNSRKITNYMIRDVFGLDDTSAKNMSRLIDKRDKLSPENFEMMAGDILQQSSKITTEQFLTLLNSKNFEEFTSRLPQTKKEHQGLRDIREVMVGLERLGVTNVRFDQTLMRGFDYYTGVVFEVFDLNPENRRAVLGGGRYDDLLSLFGNDRVTAVGFGAGDVIARDLMETYGKIKNKVDATSSDTSVNRFPPADIMICVIGEQNTPYALDIAQSLRTNPDKVNISINKDKPLRVAVDLSIKKIGDQISNASKRGITYVIVIGDEEVKTGVLKLKNLDNKEEVEIRI